MKTVLVDLYKTGSYSGFGEICDNYGRLLAKACVPDIHFIFMVPKSKIGYYGDNVDYVAFETAGKDLRTSGIHIDLWHSTDQLFKFRLRDKSIIRLLTIHDLNFIYEKKHIHKLKHYIKGWLKIRHSDWLVCISDFTRQDVLRHYKVGDRPIAMIRNGIRECEKEPRSCPKFVHDGEKFFFTIGFMLRKKNFHTLIPMMTHFPDYKLFISGRPHKPYIDEVRADISRYNMNDRVFVTGPVTNEERNYLYANCKAFMFPSLWEGCGLPIVEAMRFKKPIFTSDSTCMPETGQNYVFYWRNFNPDYMADVVKNGLAEFDDKRAESEYEYSRTYSYEEYTRNYIVLYRKILGLDN
jgi:glycosyltransferase involved in cell wall biosynthesis